MRASRFYRPLLFSKSSAKVRQFLHIIPPKDRQKSAKINAPNFFSKSGAKLLLFCDICLVVPTKLGLGYLWYSEDIRIGCLVCSVGIRIEVFLYSGDIRLWHFLYSGSIRYANAVALGGLMLRRFFRLLQCVWPVLINYYL